MPERVHQRRRGERGDLAEALRPQDRGHPAQRGVVDEHDRDEQRPRDRSDLRVERPDAAQLVDRGGPGAAPLVLGDGGRDDVGLGGGAGAGDEVVDHDGAPPPHDPSARGRSATPARRGGSRTAAAPAGSSARASSASCRRRGRAASPRRRPGVAPIGHQPSIADEHAPAALARRELADDRVVHRDTAAEPDAGEEAQGQEQLDVRRERPEHREQREDQQRDAEGLLAPDAVGHRAPGDGADGHADEVRRRDEALLARRRGRTRCRPAG